MLETTTSSFFAMSYSDIQYRKVHSVVSDFFNQLFCNTPDFVCLQLLVGDGRKMSETSNRIDERIKGCS